MLTFVFVAWLVLVVCVVSVVVVALAVSCVSCVAMMLLLLLVVLWLMLLLLLLRVSVVVSPFVPAPLLVALPIIAQQVLGVDCFRFDTPALAVAFAFAVAVAGAFSVDPGSDVAFAIAFTLAIAIAPGPAFAPPHASTSAFAVAFAVTDPKPPHRRQTQTSNIKQHGVRHTRSTTRRQTQTLTHRHRFKNTTAQANTHVDVSCTQQTHAHRPECLHYTLRPRPTFAWLEAHPVRPIQQCLASMLPWKPVV